MAQLLTLVWLKWRLSRNSLRSKKAVANQAATLMGLFLILALALTVATGLGVAAYFLSKPDALSEAFRRGATKQGLPIGSFELILFSIFAFLYLMWATIPLSMGGGKQFDAARMLMYPISLRKLFAIDFLSEFTAIQSLFAVPAIVAVSLGTALGSGRVYGSFLAAIPAILFGVALSKWLTTTIGSLVRRQRTRGESIIALIGAIAGIGGALVGQVGPLLVRHAESLRSLRWTPPGLAAYLFAGSDDNLAFFALAFGLLSFYTLLLVWATYWVARRSALGLGGERRRKLTNENERSPDYTGWQFPFASPQLSAMIEKELRYAMRNAQLRMIAFMPLILVVVRFVNSKRFGTDTHSNGGHGAQEFLTYASSLIATGGVLYVFLVLAGLSCNLFAFEEGGMRTLVLSPIQRWKILFGKNIAVAIVAALFSTLLILINGIVFQDLGPTTLLFAALSFIIFASLMGVIGNWFSMSFPKRMQFGKRLNVSGFAGLLLIPMILVLGLPPFVATLAGYLSRSLFVEFAVLGIFAAVSVGFYVVLVEFQGKSLERRELAILEAVKEPAE